MRISVVVPTYRRPDLLERCLACLAAQRLDPESFEVVVADDAASDATRTQVERWAATIRPALHYVPVTANHGPAAARNRGWEVARGELIAFTDDDCQPDPDWLAAGLATLDAGADAVAGRVIVPLPERPTDYERNEAGLATAAFVTANCFVRRSLLQAVGGFDERFQLAWREDSDLHFALLRRGVSIVRAPGAIVRHPVRPAPWGVSLRQQAKSRFNALLYRKHPQLYRQHIRRGPPWLSYAAVLALVAALGGTLARQPVIAIASWAIWIGLTLRFTHRRLRGTSRAPAHVAEMLVTSVLIPPLSIYWRLRGAWQFRVPFA